MYFGYRLEKSGRLEEERYLIFIFIIAASFLSALFSLSIWAIIIFPLLLFSFLAWPAIFFDGGLSLHDEHTYIIFFLTGQFETSNWGGYFAYAFSLSLLLNILGALLGVLFGYWIGKKHKLQFVCSKLWKPFCFFVGVTMIVSAFVLGYSVPSTVTVYWRFWWLYIGFGIILLETIFVQWLIYNALRPSRRKSLADPSIKINPNIKKEKPRTRTRNRNF